MANKSRKVVNQTRKWTDGGDIDPRRSAMDREMQRQGKHRKAIFNQTSVDSDDDLDYDDDFSGEE